MAEHALHQGGARFGAAIAAIGKALAAGVGVGQFALVGPLAAFNQVVDVGAIGPFGIAVHAQGSDLQSAAVLLLVGQGMAADGVHGQRLVFGGCGQIGGFGEQTNLQRHQVTEDARQGDHHINARTAQLAQGDQGGTSDATVAVKARQSAHQRQGLANRCAFAFEVVAAPQHHGDGGGQGVAVFDVTIQQALRLLGPVFDGKGAGDAKRVKAMQVAPGGQDLRGAQHIATRSGAHKAAIQGMQDGADFGFAGHQVVGFDQLFHHRQGAFFARQLRQLQHLFRAVALDQGLSGFAAQGLAVTGVGHRHQQVHALGLRGRAPGHMQAVGNEGVFQLQQLLGQHRHAGVDGCGRVVVPQGFGVGQIQLSGLRLQHQCQFGALRSAGLQAAPAVDGGFELGQAFVQTRL